jgi:bifunctional DNA-binding transcriptional regulator/antitoxin component of YhaV-PrlF toxin-antitoxin module
LTKYTYKVEDIFSDIPDDPKNINLRIPDEIAEQAGLEPGDNIKISWGDQGTIIIEKLGDQEDSHGEG